MGLGVTQQKINRLRYAQNQTLINPKIYLPLNNCLERIKEDLRNLKDQNRVRIFISYARSDADIEPSEMWTDSFVAAFAKHLAKTGADVQLDIFNSRYANKPAEYMKQILSVDFVILFGSMTLKKKAESKEKKHFIQGEIELIKERITQKKKIILLSLGEPELSFPSFFIQNIPSFDGSDKEPFANVECIYEEAYLGLLKDLLFNILCHCGYRKTVRDYRIKSWGYLHDEQFEVANIDAFSVNQWIESLAKADTTARLIKLLKEGKLREARHILAILPGVDDEILDVDRRDSDTGYAALHFAAQYNLSDLIITLVKDFKADINIRALSDQAETPLHVATHYNAKSAVIALLENGAKTNIPTARALTPYYEAVLRGFIDIMRILNEIETVELMKPDIYGQTPLIAACWYMCVGIEGVIAEHLAQIATKHGEDELHAYINRCDKSTECALFKVSKAERDAGELAQLLLSNGANPGSTNGNYRHTPLHDAVKYNHVGIVERLMYAGADPNAETFTGRKPIDFASVNTHQRIIELITVPRSKL